MSDGIRLSSDWCTQQVDHIFDMWDRSEGRPLTLQVASVSLTISIYAMIVRRALQSNPGGRCVIFVPKVSLARRVRRELKSQKLRVCLIGAGSPESDLWDEIVVCVSASAHRLSGHKFLVKLLDSSQLCSHGHTAQIMRHQVTASMSAEFSLHLKDADPDAAYTLAEAVQDGRARNFQPYLLQREAKDCWKSKLAKTLQATQVDADAAWQPALVVLPSPEDASALAGSLRHLGVAAAAVRGRLKRGQRATLQRVEKGQIKVLCVSHQIFERSDLPAFNTLVLDTRVSAAPILRALQPMPGVAEMKLVHVVSSSGPVSSRKLQRPTSFLIALWGQKSNPSPWKVLHADGSTALWTPEPRGWLINLCAWLQSAGRRPRYDVKEERLHAHRFKQARKHWLRNTLNAAEKELIRSAYPGLAVEKLPNRMSWLALQDLCAWMSTHQRRPQQLSEDVVERRQSLRLSRTLKRLREGKLSKAESELLRDALQNTVRPWLPIMVAWVRFYERLPRLFAKEHDERLQNRRWKRANRLLSMNVLTQAERNLMLSCLSWKRELSERPRACLLGLRAWIFTHARRPRDGVLRDAEERRQALRWKTAFKQMSNMDLSESEISLLEYCLEILDTHEDGMAQRAALE
ncbi:hypothetical protein AK812_SmicGene7698 [Symbiodinium microadriaticum]|uniref:Uncharacterized protein n=1 Tax=Symbiodinium microadriaticum TaxID=2951 RepID=A0A1Q9EMW6_SYMMI|nr:hypothetical protein AK812_SmicGene7698 [Symbiodinium microadriaticum]